MQQMQQLMLKREMYSEHQRKLELQSKKLRESKLIRTSSTVSEQNTIYPKLPPNNFIMVISNSDVTSIKSVLPRYIVLVLSN